MKTFTHDQLLEKINTIKVLIRVHTGYQSLSTKWTPDEKGYIFENKTLDGKVEWYRPINL